MIRAMLVLFDIDGTLLLSRHAGRDCFLAAAQELFGAAFSPDDRLFPGGLDPFIWREMCARHGIHDGDVQPERFRATSRECRVSRRWLWTTEVPMALPRKRNGLVPE